MANLQDFRVKRGLVVATSTALGGNVSISGNAAITGQTAFGNATSYAGPAFFNSTASFQGGNVAFNTSTMVLDFTNSRVAINATSTTVALFVQGTANVTGQLNAANVNATNAVLTNINGNTLTISGATNSSIGTTTLFVNPSLNRVGINTATPDAPLSVIGAANISSSVWIGGGSAHVGAATFSNTVGITGATTLSSTLSVASDVTILNGNVALSNTSKYFVGSITGVSNNTLRTVTAGSYLTGGGQLLTDITINVNASPSNLGSTVVARDASGNFSAGTISATLSGTATYGTYSSYLYWNGAYRAADSANYGNYIMARDGNGDVWARYFRGTATSALYADLAEKYLADKEYPVGTVLSIGGEKEVTACMWGQRAVGPVSENPAFRMNDGLEGGTFVALRGRVPVLVSGPVKKGDYLMAGNEGTACVTSATDPLMFAQALESNVDEEVKLVEALIF